MNKNEQPLPISPPLPTNQQIILNVEQQKAAIELLRSWREGDQQEQQETWDYLKRVLDEDRLSDRKLFP